MPLMEKPYWPLRLAFEKFPVGGGGVMLEPPPQAARVVAIANSRLMRGRFTSHLPASGHPWPGRGSSEEWESRGECERRGFLSPSAGFAREIASCDWAGSPFRR